MSWVKLDDQFPDHPKIAALSDGAFRAHVIAICYSARTLTDGRIPGRLARKWAGRSLKELVPCLWEPADEDFLIHDYLDYQPSRHFVTKERERISQERSKAGGKGAAKRWQSGRQTDGPDPDPSSRSRSPDPVPDPDPYPPKPPLAGGAIDAPRPLRRRRSRTPEPGSQNGELIRSAILGRFGA